MRIYMRLRIIAFTLLVAVSAACSSGSTAKIMPATPTLPATPTTVMLPTPTLIPAAPGNYGPPELRRAYHIDALLQQGITGKGQTVVVTDSYGDPQLQADLAAYSQYYHLPSPNLQILAPLGPTPPPNGDPFNAREHTGWAIETALDVEMIHAVAPDARIVVLTSPVDSTEGTPGLPEFRQLIQYAVDHHLGAISSNSWGFSEASLQDSAGQNEIRQWGPLLQQATLNQKMTFFFASGDHGVTDFTDAYYTHLSPTATTEFPADEPWATGVGATALTFGAGQPAETAWTDQGKGASGGGVSAFMSEPAFQQALPTQVQTQLHGQRGVPDVAAVGDPATGVRIYANGQWLGRIGGTSVGTPVWAGLMALADQQAGRPLGFLNPLLYQLGNSKSAATDFQDILLGNNTTHELGLTVPGYSAVPGWDPVTGFGTPNATQLIHDLIAAASG